MDNHWGSHRWEGRAEQALLDQLFLQLATAGVYEDHQLYQQMLQQGDAPLLLRQKGSEAIFQKALQYLSTLTDLIQVDLKAGSIISSGYQPLDLQRVSQLLPPALQGELCFVRRFITDSTNSDLQRPLSYWGEQYYQSLPNNLSEKVVAKIAVAEMQTGGRGRRAKAWISPLAKNLYFSFKYHFSHRSIPYLSSLSLRIGALLLEVLEELGICGAKVKWPNDIWVGQSKLAGILVESIFNSHDVEVIIGIGVNNQYDSELELVGNRPTCCELILGEPLDRNRLIARLSEKIYHLCESVEAQSYALEQGIPVREKLPDFTLIWPKISLLYGRRVQLISDRDLLIGSEVGIDESGALLVALPDGEIRTIISGDLSLREL